LDNLPLVRRRVLGALAVATAMSIIPAAPAMAAADQPELNMTAAVAALGRP